MLLPSIITQVIFSLRTDVANIRKISQNLLSRLSWANLLDKKKYACSKYLRVLVMIFCRQHA